MGVYKSLLVIIVLALFHGGAYGQERRALLVEEVEGLLRARVTPRRMATLIEKYGVSFEVTEEIRGRLRKAGADEVVMGAVEKASLEFARKKLEEERRRAEEERKRAEEEAKRKAEEERHRLEAEQALLEERKKLEAERQALEERRKGLEGSQRPPVVAAVPPAETVDDPRDVAARTLKEIIKENENASGLLISRGLMHSYGGRGHFLELVELTSNYMVTAQIVGDHPKMTAHFGDIEKVRFNASSFFSSPYVELVFRNSNRKIPPYAI